jgi:hypothetical protein
MKKRLLKKLTKQSVTVYRGIRIWKNYRGEYSQGSKSYRFMIMFPDIESYSKGTSGLRSAIDCFLKTYIPMELPV